MKNKQVKFLCYSSAVLTALTAATMITTTTQASDSFLAKGVTTAVKAAATSDLIETDVTTEATDQVFQDVEVNETNFPDPGFRAFIQAELEEKTGQKKVITADVVKDWKTLETPFKATTVPIKTLDGIQLLTALESVTLQNTSCSDITPLAQLPVLDTLKVKDNQDITFSDTAHFSSILTLSINGGNYTTFNTTAFEKLTKLDIRNTPNLTSIEVNSPLLESISLQTGNEDSHLESLKIHKTTSLKSILVYGDDTFTDLTVDEKQPTLTSLTVHGGLTKIDTSFYPALTSIDLSGNQLTELDLTQNPAIYELDISGNQISDLDLSQHQEQLASFIADGNPVTTTDFSAMTSLQTLSLANCSLTEIQLPTATDENDYNSINTLNLSGNDLKTIDLSQQIYLTDLNLAHNQLDTIDLAGIHPQSVNIANNNFSGVLDLAYTYALPTDYSNDQRILYPHGNIRHLDISGNSITYVHFDPRERAEEEVAFDGKSTNIASGKFVFHEGKYAIKASDLFGEDYNLDYVYPLIVDDLSTVDTAYASNTEIPLDNDWIKQGDWIVYNGEGKPTTFTYSYSALGTPELLQDNQDRIDQGIYKSPVSDAVVQVNLTEDVDSTVTVTFASLYEEEGSISGSIETTVNTNLDQSKIPTPTPSEGYIFDHWENSQGVRIDLANYAPSSDETIYAVFRLETVEDATNTAEATAGSEAGQNDGEQGADEADLTDKSEAYKTAYETAYQEGKAQYDEGFTDGVADATEGYDKTDLTDKSVGYQNGYTAGYESVDKDTEDTTEPTDSTEETEPSEGTTPVDSEDDQVAADTKAGNEAGALDGENGKEPANVSDKSSAYQEAYQTAYDTAKAEYDKGFVAGTADATSDKEAADTAKESTGYQNGYAAGFASTTTQAEEDAKAGSTAGTATGSIGATAGDVTNQSDAYQKAYTAAYEEAKADFDNGYQEGVTAAQKDGDAETTEGSTAFQNGYAAGFASVTPTTADPTNSSVTPAATDDTTTSSTTDSTTTDSTTPSTTDSSRKKVINVTNGNNGNGTTTNGTTTKKVAGKDYPQTGESKTLSNVLRIVGVALIAVVAMVGFIFNKRQNKAKK